MAKNRKCKKLSMKLGKGTILFLKVSHKSLIFFLDKFLIIKDGK